MQAELELAKKPVTLCHGDAHVGNTYHCPDGRVGLFDFQLTLRANWSRDVSYVIVTALDPGTRRAHERGGAKLQAVARRQSSKPFGQTIRAENNTVRSCLRPCAFFCGLCVRVFVGDYVLG